MVNTPIRQRLLTAPIGTEVVRLSYGDAVRAALLIGIYEGAWDDESVFSALEWWSALPTVLTNRPRWAFTLRDYEPAWICEGEDGEFVAVTVSTDQAGRPRYEVDISWLEETAVMCASLSELEDLINNLPT